ncbi:MAG: UDP-N-acetylmuramoyl-tripeptide--D-alanyl-D-alanine ligase [Thermoanaerobaculia bacterium]
MGFGLTAFLVLLAGCIFGARRLRQYLRFLQQDEYHNGRFLAWVRTHRLFDTKGTLVGAVGALSAGAVALGRLQPGWAYAGSLLLCATLLALTLREKDPAKVGKIKLKMTERAKRIYAASLAVMLVVLLPAVALVLAELRSPWRIAVLWLVLVAFFQATPLFLAAGNALLAGDEVRRQRRFYGEAQARLRSLHPLVIGITGSYGKTSTKAILAEMLQGSGPTFWPRASINTLMGIVRGIREGLDPRFKYAVFEMGAYRVGSIKALCDLVHPQAGIITRIGVMHLERFGSQEAIFRAKSELAAAVPPDGILVVNGDDPLCRRAAEENPKARTLRYGLDAQAGPLDCAMTEIQFALEGARFVIHWQGESYPGRTKLLGRTALSNILGAFTLAAELGVDPDYLLAVIRNLKPQSNRLELEKAGGITFLHDAYNSNPTGFRAALEVLGALPAKRKILVTPGMVELGPRQAQDNFEIAALAASVCDVVVIVGPTNREALKAGLASVQSHVEVRLLEDRDSALAYIKTGTREGDAVLIENDLPDLYERLPRF